MQEEIKRLEFSDRCLRLERQFNMLAGFEESPRVWASVMIELLKKITDAEPDAEGCRKQIIERLNAKD
jgi:hypothetical protein